MSFKPRINQPSDSILMVHQVKKQTSSGNFLLLLGTLEVFKLETMVLSKISQILEGVKILLTNSFRPLTEYMQQSVLEILNLVKILEYRPKKIHLRTTTIKINRLAMLHQNRAQETNSKDSNFTTEQLITGLALYIAKNQRQNQREQKVSNIMTHSKAIRAAQSKIRILRLNCNKRQSFL